VKDEIARFLTAIDDALAEAAGGRTLDLYHIGRSALVWQYGSAVTTSDVDVLQPRGESDLIALALTLFGKGTEGTTRYGLYLEVVPEGLPPVPAGYNKRARRVDGPWRVLRVFHLDPHDLAATKMRRFATKDREDIRQLCDLGLIDEAQLESTLEKAFWYVHEKDGDEFRDGAFRNLRVVQKYLRGEIDEF
jgi:hypothetical protein